METTVAVAGVRAIAPIRSTFRFWLELCTRNRDTDQFGHVNHAAMATLFEEARIALVFTAEALVETVGVDLLVASLSMTFHKELRAPGSVQIGSVVTRIGTSSLGMKQGVFSGDACFASAEAICVLLDKEVRKPARVSDIMRVRLMPDSR